MLHNYTSTRDLGTRYGEHQRLQMMLIYICQDYFEELVSGLLPGMTKVAADPWNFVGQDLIFFILFYFNAVLPHECSKGVESEVLIKGVLEQKD